MGQFKRVSRIGGCPENTRIGRPVSGNERINAACSVVRLLAQGLRHIQPPAMHAARLQAVVVSRKPGGAGAGVECVALHRVSF